MSEQTPKDFWPYKSPQEPLTDIQNRTRADLTRKFHPRSIEDRTDKDLFVEDDGRDE